MKNVVKVVKVVYWDLTIEEMDKNDFQNKLKDLVFKKRVYSWAF